MEGMMGEKQTCDHGHIYYGIKCNECECREALAMLAEREKGGE